MLEGCHYRWPHFLSGKEQVTLTVTVTAAEAGDGVKLTAKRLSNGALNPVLSLIEDYIADRCLLQQVINMPVGSFVSFKMSV